MSESSSVPRIRCLGANVMLRLPAAREKTAGGIIIPERAQQRDAMSSGMPWVAEVVSTGRGIWVRDTFVECPLKVGDKVLITRGGNGTLHDFGGWSYLITPFTEVLGIVEEEG